MRPGDRVMVRHDGVETLTTVLRVQRKVVQVVNPRNHSKHWNVSRPLVTPLEES